MFELFQRRHNTQTPIEQLQDEVNRLTQRNEELSAQLVKEIDAKIKWQKEAIVREEERDTVNEYLDSAHEENINLTNENRQLKEGIGHTLHALAAVQDLSTAFVKRLDMLPKWCGLPKDLAESIFADFDQDLQARKDLAKEFKRESFTTKMYADDYGVLQNGPDDNTTRFLTPVDLHDVFFGPGSRINTEIQIDPSGIEDLNIHELGLYKIKIDLGKNVTAEAKLWIVPAVTIH